MKRYTGFDELRELVMSYDKGIEYLGRTYATLFGANFRDVVASTMDGDISWTSANVPLLTKINKEVFDNKATILRYREGEDLFILFIELKTLGLKY